MSYQTLRTLKHIRRMSTTIPKTMKAFVQQENHTAAVAEIAVPKPAPHELLVKVDHVALNPADWKFVDLVSKPGVTLGFDYTGLVVQPSSTLNIGDRVAGYVLGGMGNDKGAFAEYLRVRPDLAWKVPEGLGGVKGVGYGAAFGTAAQAMYFHLGLPFPGQPQVEGSPWIFIYGGSTSLGLFAIQFAKLAGYKVVVACSPKSFDLVKEYGADEAVDYHDGPAASAAIRQITSNSLITAYNCIPEDAATKITFDSFSDAAGKRLVVVDKLNDEWAKVAEEKAVEQFRCNAFALIGMDDTTTIDAGREFYAKLCAATPDMIERGIKPAPVKLMEGGLGGINAGLELFRKGGVSGEKLVYEL